MKRDEPCCWAMPVVDYGDAQDHAAMAELVSYIYERLAGHVTTSVERVGPDNDDPAGTPDELLVRLGGRDYMVAVFPRRDQHGEEQGWPPS